jgi:sugar O-acyltransferase (sialic acid O-acetyltransferase NeuD family)
MSDQKENMLLLHGGGDHARVVLDSLLTQNKPIVGIFDPKFKGDLFGVAYVGEYDPNFTPDAKIIISIGDNKMRMHVVAKTKHSFSSVIDPSALVSPNSRLGEGSMILQRSIIQAKTEVGRHVIVNTAAQVDHDCLIGDFAHIAPGAILCGAVSVGEGAFIGAGAVIIPGQKIGAWATVGAGAVVCDSVPDFAVVAGVPARIIKYNLP